MSLIPDKNGNIKGQKSFFKNYALLHLNLSYMNALDKEWIKYLNNSLIALKMIDKSLKLSREKRLELRDPELHLTKYRLLKGLELRLICRIRIVGYSVVPECPHHPSFRGIKHLQLFAAQLLF